MVYTLSGVRLPTVPSAYKVGSSGLGSHVDKRIAHFPLLLKNQHRSCK